MVWGGVDHITSLSIDCLCLFHSHLIASSLVAPVKIRLLTMTHTLLCDTACLRMPSTV